MEHIEMVRRYFAAWINRDVTVLARVFEPDIVYSECYGPEYRGIEQIMRWFADWNERGSVLKWEIKRYVQQDSMLAVEWYFCCEYDGVTDGFDGVSMIEFSESGRIKALREFQSKAEHHFPYGES